MQPFLALFLIGFFGSSMGLLACRVWDFLKIERIPFLGTSRFFKPELKPSPAVEINPSVPAEEVQSLELPIDATVDEPIEEFAPVELEPDPIADFPLVTPIALVKPEEDERSFFDVEPPADAEEENLKQQLEARSMALVMRYEAQQGRTPVDVSKQNVGYDILSTDDTTIRHIEVKSKKSFGSILITPNELEQSEVLQESYWLYVVEHTLTESPILKIIQNPFRKFNMEPFEVMYQLKQAVPTV
jgi:hypothetical protein